MSRRLTPTARLTSARHLELSEEPVPDPGQEEALIRVTAVGLCGSDAHWYEEGSIGDAALDGGLILGHEFAGVIESGPYTGDRVAVDPAIPCRVCDFCRSGRANLCSDLRFAGHGATDGALRGHLVWPERSLVTLPDGMANANGAMLEPLGIALHAMDVTGIDRDDSVGVVGCGPIGLLLIAALRTRGVQRIVATERLDHRLDAAVRMGATHVVVATGDDREREAVLELSGGGLNAAFETAGTDQALHTAVSSVRPGGRVALVGIPTRDRTAFVASIARRKELTLSLCRRMLPEDLGRAALLVEKGLVDLNDLVSHRFPLTEVDEAFRTLVGRVGLKVIVEP